MTGGRDTNTCSGQVEEFLVEASKPALPVNEVNFEDPVTSLARAVLSPLGAVTPQRCRTRVRTI